MDDHRSAWPHAKVCDPRKPELDDDLVIVGPAPFGIGLGIGMSLGFRRGGGIPSNALVTGGVPITLGGLYILVP